MTKSQQDTVKTIATLFGVVAVVAGAAFVLGNYPTRSEWEASRERTSVEVEELREDAAQVRIEQVRLRASMTSIEKSQERNEKTQNEIRQKLDKALQPTTNSRRR